jgi:small subunit ribosomal protein S3
MGHKINPLGFRVGITEPHRAVWFAKGPKYAGLVVQDYKIRTYLKGRFMSAAVEKIHIERKADRTTITIHAGRPGVIIGDQAPRDPRQHRGQGQHSGSAQARRGGSAGG